MGSPSCPTRREGLAARRRHSQRRMRLLVGSGRDRHLVESIELARIRKGVAFPGLEDDLQRLLEPRPALAVGNAVDVVRPRRAAAPDAEIEPALADVIDGRRLLGDAQRVLERQHLYGNADPEPRGAGCDGAGDHHRLREHGAAGVEVQLRQPDAIEPPGLGRVDLIEPQLEGLALRRAGAVLELHEHPDVHAALLARPGPPVRPAHARGYLVREEKGSGPRADRIERK